MPTVAVHAFAINVPSGEVVAGTHGRSLWITSVNEIRQMTKDVMAKEAHFYKPISAVIWRPSISTGATNRRFEAENPSTGAQFAYHLKEKAGSIKLEILDSSGKGVRELTTNPEPGMHRVTWDLRRPAPAQSNGAPAQRRWGRRRGGSRVSPGVYTARLTVDGEVMEQPIQVILDPDHPDPVWLGNEEQAEVLEAELRAATAESESQEIGGDNR